MQAADGLSLDAQTAAIEHYCALSGLKLVRICRDVISGAKDQRPGLQEALSTLQRGAVWSIELNQKTAAPVIASAWAKAEGVE